MANKRANPLSGYFKSPPTAEKSKEAAKAEMEAEAGILGSTGEEQKPPEQAKDGKEQKAPAANGPAKPGEEQKPPEQAKDGKEQKAPAADGPAKPGEEQKPPEPTKDGKEQKDPAADGPAKPGEEQKPPEPTNADTLLYLGGNEQSTHEYISKLLGKETIDTRNRSQSKGRNGSMSISYQQTGRELLLPDEVRTLDNDYAILFIRGERPVMDRKYDILKHPNIKRTEDGGAKPYIAGKAFIKSYIGACIEGAIIVLACLIFSAFAASSPPVLDTSLSAVTMSWQYVAETIFNMLVLVALVKGAERIVKEMFGL